MNKTVKTIFIIHVKKWGKDGLYIDFKIKSNTYPTEQEILDGVEDCDKSYPQFSKLETTVEVEKHFIIEKC